ncbi:MAG: 16S rRNA (guanine(527)-N(7))-methyltransferase RsmG, partial [Solirubrobacterales bacterium]
MSGGEAGSGQSPEGQLEPRARESLEKVLALLRSERASVSSITEPARAWKVHVADSLSGLSVDELAAAGAIADIGSGAGFPGLALAAALPDASVDLIESVARKCEFMRRAAAAGKIVNARVVNERAETWAAAPPPDGGREAYDAVTVRAVGRLSTLAELASPLLREGGLLVAWKGRRSADEDAELAAAAQRLAMEALEVLAVGPYDGSSHRHLHIVSMSCPTPEGLPRRPGMAKK